jgi:hypothetical protein
LKRIFLIIFISFSVIPLKADDHEYYFYQPHIDFGSEAGFSPFRSFINGGYDVLRNGSHENNKENINIFQLDYRQGFITVWDNITSPMYHINKYGWHNFIHQEVFPLSLNADKAQWVPNYGHHILGSGMLYVKMAEWYDYNGWKHPRFSSFITTAAYQFLNEVLENNHYKGTNVDPIADILIFNTLGFLLFSFDGVKHFFSHTVKMYDWSLQPVFNPINGHIENAGLQFAFKYDFPFAERTALFFYFGIHGLLGVSYKVNEMSSFSFGAGTVVNRLEENLERGVRFITPVTDGSIGFFYDRNNSLLLSVIASGPRMYNLRVNVYPGIIKFGSFKPGLFVGTGKIDRFVMGVTISGSPIGILFGSD